MFRKLKSAVVFLNSFVLTRPYGNVETLSMLKLFSVLNRRILLRNLNSYGKRAFSVAVPKLWNDLPEDINLSKTKSMIIGSSRKTIGICIFLSLT